MSTEFLMDEYCFACGRENEHGLKLAIVESDSGVEARIQPPSWTQGYEKVVHGGIVSTILDEMAVWAAYKKGYKSVTAELNVRIKEAMPVNETYIARSHVLSVRHGMIQAESKIVNGNDKLIAFAHVKLMTID